MASRDFSPTAQQAKAKVFEHLQDIDRLCRRRFVSREALALEAQQYVLDKLESEDWKRVRAWQGQTEFRPFLTVITNRLLSDFQRSRFGHVRKPGWLVAKSDPLWDTAYQVLIVERHERQGAIGILQTRCAADAQEVEGIVSTILGRCAVRQTTESNVVLEEAVHLPDSGATPADALVRHDEQRLAEVLLEYLGTGEDASLPEDKRGLLLRLKPHLPWLSDEDRLLLRMRAVDGLNMPAIAKRLGLRGDPYKRYNRLIKELKAACLRAGLWVD